MSWIIKHKTRRKTGRAMPDAGYYLTVAGSINVATIEQAAEEMVEGFRDLLKLKPKPKTLWEVYSRSRTNAR
jgi:hypothetical protein